ncbi:3-deoxy-7-phosphoheptulonate synthase, partial [Kitasatospora sp. NPDC093558]|uniref:3-deoxy-7-phosphoheptulonate synthase n=1 Tax=Kitasatospora sp. NPDC093558 TaxID=3155201 RepID=UPI0034133ACE
MPIVLEERSPRSLAWEDADWLPWSHADWRERPVHQQPRWPEPRLLRQVTGWLAGGRGLAGPAEVAALRRALARVARGEAQVVQAGDCAETLDEHDHDSIAAAVRLVGGAAELLSGATGLPVIPVGRIAGQYGKPRSNDTERVGGLELPVFRGFLVNSTEPLAQARRPDPMRLVRGYEHSLATVGLLREAAARGAAPRGALLPGPGGPALWTSHEALVLDYEEAFVRRDPQTDEWYLTSTHLPWIGARTAGADDAHVRFLAGVANPVGVKVGPGLAADRLLAVCERLDPDRRAGRLVLISRIGAGQVAERLPDLVAAVRGAGHPVVWLCDPMHGNTVAGPGGLKTR